MLIKDQSTIKEGPLEAHEARVPLSCYLLMRGCFFVASHFTCMTKWHIRVDRELREQNKHWRQQTFSRGTTRQDNVAAQVRADIDVASHEKKT
jgi:hypothetical protein